LLTELTDEISHAYLDQLYAPAGLDIGAETPMEVAFAIVTEIKAVLANREGGLLRNRKGPIHAPSTLVATRPFESPKVQCEIVAV
jgi:xanthine/CO dehydrogenase XdhC/CoxF family maturation factor